MKFSLRSSALFVSLLILSALFLFACASANRNTAEVKSSTPPATGEKFSQDHVPQGKMTQPQAAQLQLGVRIKLLGLKTDQGAPIAKSVEDQLSQFEPCLNLDKNEVVRLDADFQITQQGVFEGVKVGEVVPASPAFTQCFLKQIRQIDVGPQKAALKGSLRIGTFYGSREDWIRKPIGTLGH